MRVLHVCSEFYPLLKTGGLADVTGSLPSALAKLSCDSRIVVPGFPAFMDPLLDHELLTEIPAKFGSGKINIYTCVLPGTGIVAYIISAPLLYDRTGNPYLNVNGEPYDDNYKRFALLAFVATLIAEGLDDKWLPDILHGHDWHAGLVPAYLRAYELKHNKRLAASVFTVHNLAYQGLFSASIFAELDLPDSFFTLDGLEFYNQVSFLKAGLFYADKITTVSKTYAKEIQTTEQGCGLEGLLSMRKNDLIGVLNGVDDKVWNPQIDKLIPANYTPKFRGGKSKCKRLLQKQMKISMDKDALLFVMVTRLTEQKGLNLVISQILRIIENGGQLILLGSGDKVLEDKFISLSNQYPESIAVHIGYDENLAHMVIAGGDVIIVPSRFEPCGLTQLYGLKYGTLPLVRRIGGLADTVIDVALENIADETATGFVFDAFNEEAYGSAIRRAFTLFADNKMWNMVQKQGMITDFSWDVAAKKFIELYAEIIRK